ncbi:MAG: DUF4976 domain-containing protein [Undibacterium sp.]|nr:DUF4976 domain-containing protein [Opitutaceae bacterium]
MDGRSFLPLLRGGPPPAREALYRHYPHYGNQDGFPGGAVRVGNWKLVENYEDGTVALYDLRADIGEQRDLAAAQPERVAAMRTRLHAWYREVGEQFLRSAPGGPAPWAPPP